MWEWKMREHIAGVENAGVDRRGVKCGSRLLGWKIQEQQSMESHQKKIEK